MKFIHKNNIIQIENNNDKVIIDFDIFLKLEPNYENLPEFYNTRLYIPNVSHIITGNLIQPILKETKWEHGNRYIKRIDEFKILQNILNKEEYEDNKLIENEIFKKLPYNIKRKKEYPTIEELVIAMWEKNINKIVELENKRQEIKRKYPRN